MQYWKCYHCSTIYGFKRLFTTNNRATNWIKILRIRNGRKQSTSTLISRTEIPCFYSDHKMGVTIWSQFPLELRKTKSFAMTIQTISLEFARDFFDRFLFFGVLCSLFTNKASWKSSLLRFASCKRKLQVLACRINLLQTWTWSTELSADVESDSRRVAVWLTVIGSDGWGNTK